MRAKACTRTPRIRSSCTCPAVKSRTRQTARPSCTGGSLETSSSSRAGRVTLPATSASPSTSSLSPSSSSASGGLRRVLGLGFGLAVIVGSTLGIGILRTPGLVAAQLSSSSAILWVWLVGGLFTLLGAVCFAELGTMLPEEGGYYVSARHAFGNTIGFAVGWTDWLCYCAVLGYVSIGLGELVGVLLPSLSASVTLVAIVAVVGLVAVQWAGVEVSS